MVRLTTLLLLLILVPDVPANYPDVSAKQVDYSFQLVSSENGRVSSLSADVNDGLLVVSAINDGENIIYGTLAYDDQNFHLPIHRTMAIACMTMGFGTAVEFYSVSKSNFFGLGTEIKFNDIASFPHFSSCFGMDSTWDSCISDSLDYHQDFKTLLGLKCVPKIGPEVYKVYNSLTISVNIPSKSNVVISGLDATYYLYTPSKDDMSQRMLYVMNSRYAPKDLCEMNGLKSLFTVQVAHELASKDRIGGEDEAQRISSFPVLSSKNHKYSWDSSNRSRLNLEDPWTPNDLPPYLGHDLVEPIYFCQNQSLVFGPYNSTEYILNCTDANTVIDIHSAMSGGVDKTDNVTKLCSGASICQISLDHPKRSNLGKLSIEYSCTSDYSYEFSLDSDTYPVTETFGFASHWIKDKTIGHGLLKLDVNFKGTVVKSGYVNFTESLLESCRFFCGMLGYTELLRCGNSTLDLDRVMDFTVVRSQGDIFDNEGEYFILHYSEEYPINDSTTVALLTCGPDDHFWSDNLMVVISAITNHLSLALDANQDQLYTIALPSLKEVEAEYDHYDFGYVERLSQQIKTMGNTVCQEMGFREATNVSISNTTLPNGTCIYLGPKEFSYMEEYFKDLMKSLQGIGVDAKNWKVLIPEMMYTGFSCKNVSVISLECSPEVLPVGEIVLSVFAADFKFIDYDSFLLIGSHISEDGGVKFRGPVCASPDQITHTIAEGVCQRAGFKQAWQVLTLASLLDDEEKLLSYRTSMYYQMGSGLMEVHDLAAGNFTKNTCDLGEVVIISCIGTYAPYRLKSFISETVNDNYYRVPEYKVQGNTALICSDSDTGFLDEFCAESRTDYQSNNSFSHLELIELLNLANYNESWVQEKLEIMEDLESGLYVECVTDEECEWQVKNCYTFLAVSCVKDDDEEENVDLVTESSTFLYIFANLDNLVADLTSNFGTISASVREYDKFTGVKSVSLPYLVISPQSFNESTVTKACRSGGFLDYANLTYIEGCSSCWPDRLDDREVILFNYPNELDRYLIIMRYYSDSTFEMYYQSRVTCQGSRLAVLNSNDKVSQGYSAILDYDSDGSVVKASPVLITNFDQADGLCRTFRGNGAFWFSEPETFNSSLLDGAGISSSSILNGELHCGICSVSPEHFGDCSFSNVSSSDQPKGVYLECLEPEDEERWEDLANNFLKFSKGFFSVSGFIWSDNVFELCAEHGMTLDGIKWLLSWFDVDLSTIDSFILHPSTNTTNSFGVFCQKTQANDTHCAFKSISGCNGWTIEVVFIHPVEDIELVDDILYVTDQGPVCTDNFTDHLAANFCWIFGYNKGGFSTTPLVNDSSVTISCSNDKCQFTTGPCSTGVSVRLDCQDEHVISYTFMEGYDETPRGAYGVLGALWNNSDQPRVLYVSPPAADGNMPGYSNGNLTDSIAGIFCKALGYSTGGTIRESPDDIIDEDDILLLKLDCPMSFSDRYCPSIETVTGDEVNWYSPVILTCEYQTSDIRFTWEKADSSVGKANMYLRAQYHIIYLNGSFLEVSGAVELSWRMNYNARKNVLCRTAGASKYDRKSHTQGTVVASDFQCLSDLLDPVENMTTDCTYEVNYNFTGFDPNSYLYIECENESAVFWIKQRYDLGLPLGYIAVNITTDSGQYTYPVYAYLSSRYSSIYKELGLTSEQVKVTKNPKYNDVSNWWSARRTLRYFYRYSDGTFGMDTMGLSYYDRLLYIEFNEYPYIDSNSLSYRLVRKDRKSSLFKDMLLVDYNLIHDPKEETTEPRQAYYDALVCAKDIPETFLLEVCQELGFDYFGMSTTAGEYGVSNTTLDHYDWGIGSVHYREMTHFKIGNGWCTEKADALVLECGFDKQPQSFKLHLINLNDVVPTINPLDSQDWKPPAYSDPSSGYVVATLNFTDDPLMSGLVCAESLTNEIMLGICHEMGFHTLISNFSRYTESNALVKGFSFDRYYKNLTDSTMGDCPERRVVWLECGFDASLCEDFLLNGYLVSKCSHPTKTDEQNTFKCPNSTQVYRVTPDVKRPCDLSFSSLCQDDFICQTGDNAISNTTVIVSGSIVEGYLKCKDGDATVDITCKNNFDPNILCEEEEVVSGSCYAAGTMGIRGTSMNCSHPVSGGNRIVPVNWICDGIWDCLNGEDEEDCTTWGHLKFCNDTIILATSKICAPQNDNLNGQFGEVCPSNDFLNHYDCGYHSESSDKYLRGCGYNGFSYTLNADMICSDRIAELRKNGGYKLCEDDIDKQCTTTSTGCTVHKHQLCDEVSDCANDEDEDNVVCDTMTTDLKCFRKFHNGGEFTAMESPIPVAWLMDGVKDCWNGMDEEVFVECQPVVNGSDPRLVDNADTCSDLTTFKCFHAGTAVDMAYVCDRITSCKSESDMCEESRNIKAVSATVQESGNLVAGPANIVKKKHLGHCLPGLESMGKTFPHLGECNEGEFYIDKPVEGVTLDYVVYPTVQGSIDCMGVFGEAYIYLACLGLCESRGIECPLQVLQPDSCVNFQGEIDSALSSYGNTTTKIFALSSSGTTSEGEIDSALASYGNTTTKIFVLSSSGTTSYVNNYFLCTNKNCIPYSKVCDLVDDCGDRSDEHHTVCKNVFECENGDYIQMHSKCDGEFDCTDLSDECNVDCSADIIDNIGLLAFSFTLGCLAVVANGIIIIKFFFTFGKSKSSTAILNQLLIFFISIGDFCMGLYLVLISISATYYKAREEFCKSRFKWLTGSECAALGILSAFGSQISLLSMTILSLSRVVSLRNVLVPRNVNRKSVAKFTFYCVGMCPD
eukprot:sb/3460407/